ncbi:S-adenosyl-L-methionine-dependent methyltransferase [Trametes cingulata]|nr:S-adenosyl-L-methionine-dependent methyltransferase [Trametes cingulata]
MSPSLPLRRGWILTTSLSRLANAQTVVESGNNHLQEVLPREAPRNLWTPSNMATTTTDPAKFARMRELIAEHREKGWDDAWKAELTPWDAGTSQPALQELIVSGGLDLPRSGRALVPGCGRGYDAVYLANSLGLETIGIDVSPTAIEAAEKYKNDVSASGNLKFQVVDFFALDGETFDLVYDYTFFVAIPPSMRSAWAKQMSKLVKPGGFLITLVYPILPYTDVGPPFYVRPEHYEEVLGAGWTKIWDKVPEKTLDTHVGKERMMVWRKL